MIYEHFKKVKLYQKKNASDHENVAMKAIFCKGGFLEHCSILHRITSEILPGIVLGRNKIVFTSRFQQRLSLTLL